MQDHNRSSPQLSQIIPTQTFPEQDDIQLSQIAPTQIFPEQEDTPTTSKPLTRTPSLKNELDTMKKQLKAIENEISYFPEIREFISQQHDALKQNKTQLRSQKRIHELEKSQLKAEEEIQKAKAKLLEAYNYNGDLKDKIAEYQNKLGRAEREIDRLIKVNEGQLALLKAAEKVNTIPVIAIPKPTNPSNLATTNSQTPKPCPDRTKPHTERATPTAKATPSKASPSKLEHCINVKSPHILSMMEVYSGRPYKVPEIAFQTEKAQFILGIDSPEAIHIYNLQDGKAAKQYARENLPYSERWQRAKTKVIRNILRAVLKQDTIFKDALAATGNKLIRHTVSDTFWGTGGISRSDGKNMYWEILMQLRIELQTTDNKEENQGTQSTPFSVQLNKGTECILITDSQSKHIDARYLLGAKKVHIQKCPTASSMKTFVQELSHGPVRLQITHIIVNNGINDVRNGRPAEVTAAQQIESIEALKCVCPNARLYYCMPLSKSTNTQVELLGHKICEYSIDSNVTFIRHHVPPALFVDEYHISAEGTRMYVSKLHWYTRKHQQLQQEGHEESQRQSYTDSYTDDTQARKSRSIPARAPKQSYQQQCEPIVDQAAPWRMRRPSYQGRRAP